MKYLLASVASTILLIFYASNCFTLASITNDPIMLQALRRISLICSSASRDYWEGNRLASQRNLSYFARRAWFLLSEPHPSVQGIRKRQQARLLSTLLLLALPILGISQFTSELVIAPTAIFLVTSILVFIAYLGTRSRFFDISLGVTLAGFTILPIVIFLFGTTWEAADLPRLMVWVTVALIGGTLLSHTRVVLLQGVSMILAIAFIVGVVFEVPFAGYVTHLVTAIIITALMCVASYMLESYISQLDYHAIESERKAQELEVYTQLLRHDLRNDLQAVLNSVELAEMFLNIDQEKVEESLKMSQNLGQRMAQLLNIFSMPPEQPGTNLVEHIREMALEAEETYSNLEVNVSSTDAVQHRSFTASRLLPLVWTNILRNAAQYCGDPASVKFDISVEKDSFHVIISDDGPGVPEEKKEWLFRRGSNDSAGSGLGLYLSKIVLESHNGSIELADNDEGQIGSKFIVRIPANLLES